MNRKKFLAGLISGTGLFFTDISGLSAASTNRHKHIKVPPYLKVGDKIGITCPSGAVTAKEIEACIRQLENWGFQPVIGNTVGKKDFTFGGTDEERIQDFQLMIDQAEIKAILCARGGYGVVRIIDQLDFSSFRHQPKWVIGFSDITVFHSHLHAQGFASLHAKMCGSFPVDWAKADTIQTETINTIKSALMGEPLLYKVLPNSYNRLGMTKGLLVGGNLKMLETMAATPSDISTRGKILFVEDVGEALYNIDRMFCNLLRTGKLHHLKGLIIGSFTSIRPDPPEETFGKTVYEIVTEKIKNFDFPVCFDFPVGHQKNNVALKCGLPHQLIITANEVTLREA